MVCEDPVGRTVENHERRHHGPFTESGFSLVEELGQNRIGLYLHCVFAPRRPHHVVDHVRIALRTVKDMIAVPPSDGTPVAARVPIKARMSVTQQIRPGLEQPHQFDTLLIQFSGTFGTRMQSSDVKPQTLDAVLVLRFGRGEKPALGVVMKIEVGRNQVGVVLVG